jgi:alkylation response protein AidB-like acyl-CoA dehydrogenase
MFELNKEQRDVKNAAREFAEGELSDIAEVYDQDEQFPMELWKKACELGFIGISINEEFNGAGLGLLEQVLLLEEFWRIDPGCGNILLTTLGSEYIQEYGNTTQKMVFLSSLANGGSIIGTVIDQDVIFDAFEYIKGRGESFTINGSSRFVMNGDIADQLVIVARSKSNQSDEKHCYSTFIIDKKWPGVTTTPLSDKLGIRATDISELYLDKVSVPKENLLGKENEGFQHVRGFFDRLNIYSSAQALGLSQGCLERSISYSRQRVQFGHPIGWFQLTQFKIADMLGRIEAVRLLLYKTSLEFDRGVRDRKNLAVTSALAKDIAMQVVTEAMQIHGGYGYMKEMGIERYYRDAQFLELFGDTKEDLKTLVAKDVLGKL